jgi:hypothetical protein
VSKPKRPAAAASDSYGDRHEQHSFEHHRPAVASVRGGSTSARAEIARSRPLKISEWMGNRAYHYKSPAKPAGSRIAVCRISQLLDPPHHRAEVGGAEQDAPPGASAE